MKQLVLILFVAFSSLLYGCSKGPKPINWGKDNCDQCKMTLVDQKFGVELANPKGKIFKFDDVKCASGYIHAHKDVTFTVYLVDYGNQGSFVESGKAFFLKSDKIRTPMGSDIAVFSSKEKLQSTQAEKGGQPLGWTEVLQLFSE